MKLTYQDYGTSILLFIGGDSPEQVFGDYLMLYNWNATSSEPTRITDTTISVWSTEERLYKFIFNRHVMKLSEGKGRSTAKGNEVAAKAFELTERDFDAIGRDKYRSFKTFVDFYEMGQISAENEELNFEDQCTLDSFKNR